MNSPRSVASLARRCTFVEADRARAEIDHVEKAAGHDEVLVKVHFIVMSFSALFSLVLFLFGLSFVGGVSSCFITPRNA
jgi:hypothetical protein